MSDEPRGFPGWRPLLWTTACAVGLVLCLPEIMMPHLRGFYQRHFPDVVAQWPLNGSFSAIRTFDDRDDNLYAARMHEASRKPVPFDPYIKENHSRWLLTTDLLSFVFMGLMARITGSVSSGWVLARFVGVTLWVVGLYLLIFEVSDNRRWALAASVLAALYWDLAGIVNMDLDHGRCLGAVKDVLLHCSYFMGHYGWNFGAGRLANPALTYPPLFFAIYLILRGVRRGDRTLLTAGAVLGGSLVYFHPDVGVVYLSGVPLFILLQCWSDRKLHWASACSWVVSALLGLPWLVEHIHMSPDMLLRAGIALDHSFDWFGLLWAAGAAFCLLRRRRDPGLLFIGSVLGAISVLAELQCVTGHREGIGHWDMLGGLFTFVLAAGWAGRRLADFRPYLWVIALLLTWAAGRGISYAALRFPYQALPKDMEDAFDFLNKNTPADSVVAPLGPLENMFLPVYTQNKTLVGFSFILASDLPARDLVQRQRRAFALFGVSEAEVLRKLASPEVAQAPALWDQDFWRGRVDWEDREWSLFGVNDNLPRSNYVDLLRDLQNTPLDERPEVDYLWLGPFERSLVPPAARARLGKPLYENGTVGIYPARLAKRS